MKKTIAWLKELEAKATPAPWALAIESGEYILMNEDYSKSIGTDADLEFIAELRNNWPKIVAALEGKK